MKDEPAFPYNHLQDMVYGGLTKREWMAGMALQGLLPAFKFGWDEKNLAETALKFADAMIAAAGKKDSGDSQRTGIVG